MVLIVETPLAIGDLLLAIKGLNSRIPNFHWKSSQLSVIPTTEGLSSRNPSYPWSLSLLSIIPAIEGLSSRNPSCSWRSSLLFVIPVTEGLSSKNPSYCWIFSLLSITSVVETHLTTGHIHLFSKREPYQQKKLSFRLKNFPLSIISRKRGSNQQ